MDLETRRIRWLSRASFFLFAVIAGFVQAQSSATYTYDALGRVVTVVDSTGTSTYTYDAAGNRKIVATVPNRSPNTVNDTASVVAGQMVSIDVLANDSDPDGDSLTVVAAGAASKGSTAALPGLVRYTASAGQSGQDSFIYTVSDGRNGSATGTVTVNITPPNHLPVAVADNWSSAYGTAVTANPRVNDSDPDGDTLIITAVGTPAHGSASFTSTSVTYKPATGFSGGDSFGYTISDGRGGTASSTISVTVASRPNRPPVAVADSWSTAYGTAVTANPRVNDSDPDGDTLIITAVGTPAHGSASFTSTSVTYTPATGFSGGDSLSYTISDGHGGTASSTISVTVAPRPNRPPVAVADSWSTAYGTAVTANPRVNDSDPDGDTLSVTAVGTPAHGSANFTSTSVTYKPATGFSGGDSFGYTISDGRGGTASSTISVTVAPRPNHSPVAVADSASASAPVGELADVCIAVLANDSDPDGDTLSIAGFTQASAGTVVRSGNLLCYSVYAGNITRTFTYTISDGFGGSSTATVTVKVTIER